MNETRAINDNTLKSLGFTYQNIVALRDCFDLQEGELLQIEVNGDISITSAEKQGGRVQKEVKHHLNSEAMSERDIDLWKTLANWYDEYERVKPFEKLVLHTTAQIDLLSPFYGWNALNGMEKLNRLREIGAQKRKENRDSVRNTKESLLEIMTKAAFYRFLRDFSSWILKKPSSII